MENIQQKLHFIEILKFVSSSKNLSGCSDGIIRLRTHIGQSENCPRCHKQAQKATTVLQSEVLQTLSHDSQNGLSVNQTQIVGPEFVFQSSQLCKCFRTETKKALKQFGN